MRMSMTAAGLLMLLRAAIATAGQSGDYLRDARIERAQGEVTVVANDPRPLAQVLLAVLPEYGWCVDYEDPPYQSSLELLDVTGASWKAAHPDGPRALGIRGGEFRPRYPETALTPISPQEQGAVLRKIVADFNASGNPGQFAVREHRDGRLEVVGTSVKDERGAQLQTPSVLDTPITTRAGLMSLSDALDAILQALNSRSVTKVGLGGTMNNLMIQTEVTLTGVEMPARDALHWALSQAKVRTYWLMYYAPESKAYFLNIRPATRPRYDASGKRRNEIIREP